MVHHVLWESPEVLFEDVLLIGILVVMSLDMEDFPPSGFIDGFRVVEHVPGQDFSAEAFKKREAPHAPFLFAVRSITPRTLWTLRREGVLPDTISDKEFSCIHRVHSGTLISYMSRLVVRDAAKEGLECGTECLSITTDLEHAEALVDQNFVEGRLQVVYRIRIPVDEEILTARALLRSCPETISIIEAALARAGEARSPSSPSLPPPSSPLSSPSSSPSSSPLLPASSPP